MPFTCKRRLSTEAVSFQGTHCLAVKKSGSEDFPVAVVIIPCQPELFQQHFKHWCKYAGRDVLAEIFISYSCSAFLS
jgi:hypothetical protein